jgi:biopolymer transport protein ExbD
MRRRKTSLISIREVCDINMTPMMDLTFILLITFIITFPMIEQGISVQLPKGKAASINKEKARSVTVDINGNLYLDEQPIAKMDLIPTLRENLPPLVFVRADKDIRYGQVTDILSLLHEVDTKITLVTQAED